jgi:type IV secretory pathway TrbL component
MLDGVARFMRNQFDKMFMRLGVATKDEVSSLRRRVRALEAEGAGKETAARGTSDTSPAKRKTTASAGSESRKTAAKRSPARKPSAKKTARKGSRPAGQA